MERLGERYDEYYGFDCDNYDAYDPFYEPGDVVRYCDLCDCEECPKYGYDCDGRCDK